MDKIIKIKMEYANVAYLGKSQKRNVFKVTKAISFEAKTKQNIDVRP